MCSILCNHFQSPIAQVLNRDYKVNSSDKRIFNIFIIGQPCNIEMQPVVVGLQGIIERPVISIFQNRIYCPLWGTGTKIKDGGADRVLDTNCGALAVCSLTGRWRGEGH